MRQGFHNTKYKTDFALLPFCLMDGRTQNWQCECVSADMCIMGSGGSSVVECQTRDQEVSGSSPGRRIFFSRVNFLC